MNQFLLRPITESGNVTDEQVAELRSMPGVFVSHVLTCIVAIRFDGDTAALESLLADSAWDQTNTTQIGPELDDVLMSFAVERTLPTKADLQRYVAAFPQFHRELIEFAVSLVEDHLHDNFLRETMGTGPFH